MRIVLLCGGAGTRFDNIYPKPLNLVNGIPMIHYVIKTLPTNKLTVVYHIDLDLYGFKQYLINNFKEIEFEFIPIYFQTRGPAESVFLGLKDLSNVEERVLILDNDNIYQDLDFNNLPQTNFIFYKKNNTQLYHYSFVKVEDNNLVQSIEERKPISDYICVGGYGFESIRLCLEYCKKTILENITEPYMSYVCTNLLKDGHQIYGHHLPDCYSIGTPNDIVLNKERIPKIPLRIVFDLDNTIVTYPNIYKDYSTVQPINCIVEFMKQMKEDGHTIIINTARNMVSSNHNVGKSLKNIGLTTLQSLQNLGIPYDEIHFGKPYGDLYIDDKSFNTYDLGLFKQMGFYNYISGLKNFKTNKYNKLVKINKNHIVKFGNNLSGEIFFYKMISNHTINNLFPKIVQYDSENSITMDFINGTNFNKIYSEGLLQPQLFKKFLNCIRELHSADIEDNVQLSKEEISNHYLNKFETRSQEKEHYPFQDFNDVYLKIKNNLLEFLSKDRKINKIIHGDLWFSNVMFYKNNFVLFDMRGKINDTFTIKGHIDYDYAKIYQSIVGLDYIIEYDSEIPDKIREEIENIFWNYYPGDKLELQKLTAYLIYNTFHAYEKDFELSKKEKIWNLIKKYL